MDSIISRSTFKISDNISLNYILDKREDYLAMEFDGYLTINSKHIDKFNSDIVFLFLNYSISSHVLTNCEFKSLKKKDRKHCGDVIVVSEQAIKNRHTVVFFGGFEIGFKDIYEFSKAFKKIGKVKR